MKEKLRQITIINYILNDIEYCKKKQEQRKKEGIKDNGSFIGVVDVILILLLFPVWLLIELVHQNN